MWDQVKLWFGAVDVVVTSIALVAFAASLLLGRPTLRRFPWW